MKTRKLKAFTLVEILIVVVIIGILIGALVPRMTAAQGRARDVARKNDLSQIQAAIIVSYQDHGVYPWWDAAIEWTGVSAIESELLSSLNSIPVDPLKASFTWLNGNNYVDWEYAYMITSSNGTTNWWFLLMAKTESDGWSNWVQCDTNTGKIAKNTDISDVNLCSKVTKSTDGSTCTNDGAWGECKYANATQLRYVLKY